VKLFPDIKVFPLFDSVSEGELRALVAAASAHDDRYHPPNFFSFFAVQEAYVQSPPTKPESTAAPSGSVGKLVVT
jgi:hypothetical protein